MSTTIATNALYTVHIVNDATVDSGHDCPQCDTEGAFIEVNLYVRRQGEYVRFVECCVTCARRIAVTESPDEVLIEVPKLLAVTVAPHLTTV